MGEDYDDLDWDDVFDGMADADADAAGADSDVSGEASEDEEAPAPVPVKKAKRAGKKKKDNAMLKEPAKLLKIENSTSCRKQNQKSVSAGSRQCERIVFANESLVILVDLTRETVVPSLIRVLNGFLYYI